MNLEDGTLSKISLFEKRQILYEPTYEGYIEPSDA